MEAVILEKQLIPLNLTKMALDLTALDITLYRGSQVDPKGVLRMSSASDLRPFFTVVALHNIIYPSTRYD